MSDSEHRFPAAIRPVSRDTGCVKLRALKCFDEVHQQLCDGQPLTAVAKFIQNDRGEYLDVELSTVVNALRYYRSTIPPGDLVAQRLPAAFNAAAKKLQKGVDEVTELEWLSRFQKRRLRIDGETEKKINKLLPTMTQEVRAHVEVLRTLASVKMDLGVNKRHLGSLEVDATLVADVVGRYGTAGVGKVLQSSESRQKVMGIAEKFLALAAREVRDASAGSEDAEVVESETESETESVPEPVPPPKPDPGASGA
jgi:hypothetical protein